MRKLKRYCFVSGRSLSCLVRFSRSRGLFLGLVILLTILAALPEIKPVKAQVITPFTIRFQINARGNITAAANTLMTCPLSDNDCADARMGIASDQDDLNNNSYNMERVDSDSDPTTFTSSSASLQLPSGSTVLFAGLYWGADTDDGNGGQDAPNPSARAQVLFKAPGSLLYTTLDGAIIGDQGTRYHAFEDVTALVQAAGFGEYTIANVQSATGEDRYAGWAIVVVYGSTTEPARNLTVFDGLANVDFNNTATINVSGFLTPPAGPVNTLLGVLAYEGDRGLTGDSLRLEGVGVGNDNNPGSNFFNSTVSGPNGLSTAKTPNYVNQFGFDTDLFDVTGVLGNSQTDAQIQLTTGGETYFPGVVTFATAIFYPQFSSTKTASEFGGALPFQAGDIIEYNISYTNDGDDASINSVITDAIPANTTYVPGSLAIEGVAKGDLLLDGDEANFDGGNNQVVFRVGTGATQALGGSIAVGATVNVRFRVMIDAMTPNGTAITNMATLNYEGVSIPGTNEQDSPPVTVVVGAPTADIVVQKFIESPPMNNVIQYRLLVFNAGPDPTVASIEDVFTQQLNSVVWTCTAAGGATCPAPAGVGDIDGDAPLPVGGSVTFIITAGYNELGRLMNTATADPPPNVTDPNLANNIDSVEVAAGLPADVSTTKTASVLTAVPGQAVTYTVVVTNNSLFALTDVRITDAVPPTVIYGSSTCTPIVGATNCDSPTIQPNNILTTFADMEPGASVTLTIEGTFAPDAIGNIVNNVGAFLPEGFFDQTIGNNFAIAGTFVSTATAVKFVGAEAERYDSGVLLSWRTGFEVSNLGFRVYREFSDKRTLITPELIAGSALNLGPFTKMQSGSEYTWFDPKPLRSGDVSYWIEEIDLSGKSTWHGPFAVDDESSSRRPSRPIRSSQTLSELGGGSHFDAVTRPVEVRATIPVGFAAAPVREVESIRQGAVKIGVGQEGWYRLSGQSLISSGFAPDVDPRQIELVVDGRQVPIRVTGDSNGKLDPDDAFEFYGIGLNTPSTDTRAYFLRAGSGAAARIALEPPGTGGTGLPPSTFLETIELRDKINYFSGLLNGEAENYFGAVVNQNQTEQRLTLQDLDPQASGNVDVEIALQGVTDQQHVVSLSLNNENLSAISFKGRVLFTARLNVSHRLLREGENIVRLRGTSPGADVSFVDHIRLSYRRLFRAKDDQLVFRAQGAQSVRIDGFTRSDVRVFDVTVADAPREVSATVSPQAGAFAVALVTPSTGERRLLALSGARAIEASILRSVQRPKQPFVKRVSADKGLVIITHSSFESQVAPLVKARMSEGLKVLVIDIEDIYDKFSYGHKSPAAIRDYLAYVTDSGKSGPTHVLLFGDATSDPRDYRGRGNFDLVPTKIVETGLLETASDDWFADFDNDGTPELALGRLPARTPEEAAALVGKTLKYDGTAPSGEVVLVSDVNDSYNFSGVSQHLAGIIPPGRTITPIDRGVLGDLEARSRLLSSLNRGPRLVAYVGHGSTTLWRSNLLTAADARVLPNSEQPSLFLLMTCLNGYFIDIGAGSFAESLLQAPGGAALVWASSGYTSPSGQELASREFMKQLFGWQATVGEAALRAKAAMNDLDVRRTWVLFGDPTRRLR